MNPHQPTPPADRQSLFEQLLTTYGNLSFECGSFEMDRPCDKSPLQLLDDYMELSIKTGQAKQDVIAHNKALREALEGLLDGIYGANSGHGCARGADMANLTAAMGIARQALAAAGRDT